MFFSGTTVSTVSNSNSDLSIQHFPVTHCSPLSVELTRPAASSPFAFALRGDTGGRARVRVPTPEDLPANFRLPVICAASYLYHIDFTVDSVDSVHRDDDLLESTSCPSSVNVSVQVSTWLSGLPAHGSRVALSYLSRVERDRIQR